MKSLFKDGSFFIWFTGLGLGISLIMITGIILLIFINGSSFFWVSDIVQLKTDAGESYLAQVLTVEDIPKNNLPEELREKKLKRWQLKIGNRDVYGSDFMWIDESSVTQLNYPENAVMLERTEFGNFFGFIKDIRSGNKSLLNQNKPALEQVNEYIDFTTAVRRELIRIEKSEIGSVNYNIEKLRLRIKKIEYENRNNPQSGTEQIAEIRKEIAQLNQNYEILNRKSDSLKALGNKYILLMETADGKSVPINFINVLRAVQPNNMNFFCKTGFVITKLTEFITDDPRESNTEGGVFPAIFGTIMMVLLMSIVVVPFGVLAALYLREYAKQGPLVQTVRIAVNNLAGVPSIVFGVFGLGFFVYFIGGSIDQLFYPEVLPTPTWGTGGILWASLTLSLLTVPVVIVATEEALASIPRGVREASYGLGATKWQTMQRVVIPAAAPGILTGVILAMARGAGEVAPLMITGVVKLAPSLPFDWNFPFFHLDRKFMHLGFHIYDVGFQSPNVEAAMPMVYMTTLLLIAIVILLNITAMVIRARLRKKYQGSAF